MFGHTSPLISYSLGSYHRSDIASLLMHAPSTLEKQTAPRKHTALLAQCEISIPVQPKKTGLHGVFAKLWREETQRDLSDNQSPPFLQSLQKYDYLIAGARVYTRFKDLRVYLE